MWARAREAGRQPSPQNQSKGRIAEGDGGVGWEFGEEGGIYFWVGEEDMPQSVMRQGAFKISMRCIEYG